MPVPRVSVRNWVRKPIRPRAGTMNSSLTQPVPWLVMDSIRPRRTEISEVTVPRYSSGTSTDSRSTGSKTTPSVSRGTAGGGPPGKLVVLPPHRLHQDGQRELAPAAYLPGVGPVGGQHVE